MKKILLLLFSVSTITAYSEPTKIPDGYTLQTMEPTGGKIIRPNDWHYAEAHRSSESFQWIISKEKIEKGKGYVTGTSIQTFIGAGAATKKSPEEFIRDFYESKKESADIVHQTCDPENQGLFTRICLETTEGEYRILYSCFWGTSGMDVVVISTSGTKSELWEENKEIFNMMSRFELIDMTRFEPKQTANKAVERNAE